VPEFVVDVSADALVKSSRFLLHNIPQLLHVKFERRSHLTILDWLEHLELHWFESCVAYTRQEKGLNSFHLRCLRRILALSDRTWPQWSWNVLHAPLLSPRCQQWLGNVHRMPDDRIPKHDLYGKPLTEIRNVGRPYLCYTDICNYDTKVAGIDINNWETSTSDRGNWRSILQTSMKRR